MNEQEDEEEDEDDEEEAGSGGRETGEPDAEPEAAEAADPLFVCSKTGPRETEGGGGSGSGGGETDAERDDGEEGADEEELELEGLITSLQTPITSAPLSQGCRGDERGGSVEGEERGKAEGTQRLGTEEGEVGWRKSCKNERRKQQNEADKHRGRKEG